MNVADKKRRVTPLTEEAAHFNLRMPVSLRESVEKAAANAGISMNAFLNRAVLSAVSGDVTASSSIASYRLALLSSKKKLSADERAELAFIKNRWPELQV